MIRIPSSAILARVAGEMSDPPLVAGSRAVVADNTAVVIVILQEHLSGPERWRVLVEANQDLDQTVIEVQPEWVQILMPVDGETVEELAERTETARLWAEGQEERRLRAAEAAQKRAARRAAAAAQSADAAHRLVLARADEIEEAARLAAPRCAVRLLSAYPGSDAPVLALDQRRAEALLSTTHPLPPWAIDLFTSGDHLEYILRHLFTARMVTLAAVPAVCKSWRLEWRRLLDEAGMPNSTGRLLLAHPAYPRSGAQTLSSFPPPSLAVATQRGSSPQGPATVYGPVDQPHAHCARRALRSPRPALAAPCARRSLLSPLPALAACPLLSLARHSSPRVGRGTHGFPWHRSTLLSLPDGSFAFDDEEVCIAQCMHGLSACMASLHAISHRSHLSLCMQALETSADGAATQARAGISALSPHGELTPFLITFYDSTGA